MLLLFWGHMGRESRVRQVFGGDPYVHQVFLNEILEDLSVAPLPESGREKWGSFELVYGYMCIADCPFVSFSLPLDGVYAWSNLRISLAIGVSAFDPVDEMSMKLRCTETDKRRVGCSSCSYRGESNNIMSR